MSGRTLLWVVVLIVWSVASFLAGFDYGIGAAPKPEPVITTVYKEPTDDQLMEFWFGKADKSKLKRRVCGK